MFERSLLDSSTPRKTLPLACLLESGLVGVLILVPLINTRALTFNSIRTVVDEPPPSGPSEIWLLGGTDLRGNGGGADAMINRLLAGQTPPPPPPLTNRVQAVRQIRVGGDVIAAKGIYQPAPTYPLAAQRARLQGVVRLEALIATDGTIQNLRALGGHPWLVPAALEAVARWRYQPTLLNGEPVEVITNIEVKFTLEE
ncbi:MAG: energy transducer TonB [Acidobacteriia bacterium]|nr:energy transducer TonB [Terriglobia bacterium]